MTWTEDCPPRRRNLLRYGKHLDVGQRIDKRCILHQCDDLVCHGGQNNLYHLWQHNLKKGLDLGISQKRRRLVLSPGYGLYAGTVNFREIRRIVQRKPNHDGGELIVSDIHSPQIEGTEIPHQKLQHKGGSSHDGDINLHKPAHRLKPARPPKIDNHSQRQ